MPSSSPSSPSPPLSLALDLPGCSSTPASASRSGWAFLVVLGSLTRLALLLAGPSEGARSAAALLRIFAAGGVLDLWVAAWCVLPLVAYLALLPERWWQARWQKKALGAVLAAVLYGVLFAAAAEWFFFEEFDSRFNFVAVDYLLYPTEVVTNIWQSYPTAIRN